MPEPSLPSTPLSLVPPLPAILPWTAPPYNSEDLRFFGRFIAREFGDDAHLAGERELEWYNEQLGGGLTIEQCNVLRTMTVAMCIGRTRELRQVDDLLYTPPGTPADEPRNRARRAGLMARLSDRIDAGIGPFQTPAWEPNGLQNAAAEARSPHEGGKGAEFGRLVLLEEGGGGLRMEHEAAERGNGMPVDAERMRRVSRRINIFALWTVALLLVLLILLAKAPREDGRMRFVPSPSGVSAPQTGVDVDGVGR